MNRAFVLAALCVIAASDAAASAQVHKIAETLDALGEAAINAPPLSSHSTFIYSPEYANFASYGPNVIPVLLERIATDQDARRTGMWRGLLDVATRMQAFPYSTSPRIINGIDWHEPELGGLPRVSFSLDAPTSSSTDTTPLHELWLGRDASPKCTTRLAAFSLEGRLLNPSTSDLSGEDFRRFFRLTCNYGILDLPVHIRLVGSENSILAFHAFFACSGLRRNLGHYPPHFLDQVRQTEGLYPTHADRVSAVRVWWGKARPTFSLLPDLQAEIDDAMSALPSFHPTP